MITEQTNASRADHLKALPQYLIPGHLLSRLIFGFTRIRWRTIREPFTAWFIRRFKVDMSEALEEDPFAYEHFNAFFTRTLKPELRPLEKDRKAVVSPVDGQVSQALLIDGDTLFQAKGHTYSLSELLGGLDKRAAPFYGGHFTTLYLAPPDYHRIHMPLTGTLREMIHIPGRLFSVSPATTRVIPALFTRNERVVSLFDTVAGPMALVKVGAVNVGSIETVWAGRITPPAGHLTRRYLYAEEKQTKIARGDEMGRFNMGSTVILIFGPSAVEWSDALKPGAVVRMGQRIGTLSK